MLHTDIASITESFLSHLDSHLLTNTPLPADVGTTVGHFAFRVETMPDFTFPPHHPLWIFSLTSCHFYLSCPPTHLTSISLPWPIGSVMEFQTTQMGYDLASHAYGLQTQKLLAKHTSLSFWDMEISTEALRGGHHCSILPVGKLRLWRVKYPVQSHRARIGRSRIGTQVLRDRILCHFPSTCFLLIAWTVVWFYTLSLMHPIRCSGKNSFLHYSLIPKPSRMKWTLISQKEHSRNYLPMEAAWHIKREKA